MTADLISLAEYRRKRPASPPFTVPGEPNLVLLAASMWVAVWWTLTALAIGSAMR